MTEPFKQMLDKKTLLFDGATGTLLQKYGMPVGVSPEAFCIEHPEIIQRVQRDYFQAGADVVLAPTFGANRIKLKNYGLETKVTEMNRRLAEISLQVAREEKKWVAGEMGPTGIFYQPFGETAFEEGLEIFGEQAKALGEAGVDFIAIMTMIDIQEARIALLAAKEMTDLPVVVFMTFDESQRTLTGSDPLTCLNVFQSLGAAGFGINCSTGPDKMLEIVKTIAPWATIPIFVKPNAGLPVIQKGETVFPMAADAFAAFAKPFLDAGVSGLGGCCGTTPEHIHLSAQALKGCKRDTTAKASLPLLISSARKSVRLDAGQAEPIRVIGERINPTGKLKLQETLKAGQMGLVKEFAREQKEQGADILDVNVGMPGIDEKAVMVQAVKELAVISDLPLCIDSSKPEVIAAALQIYPGRVLVNSLSGEAEKLAHLVPVLKKYGAAFITLPLDDAGIPETVTERKKVLKTIIAACEKAGIDCQAMVVDGLVMTVSSNPEHSRTTLETLAYVTRELKLNTVLGLSNISFGLPARGLVNSTFLAMAAGQGLSAVIANPAVELVMDVKHSAEVLTGRDLQSRRFIARFKDSAVSGPAASTKQPDQTPTERVQECIVKGDKDVVEPLLQTCLDQGTKAIEIVQKIMVPAIQLVGDKFNQREYFLPQLIGSAETMEKGVAYLTPYLKQEDHKKKGCGVIATVKGDVHDIGKKIVALLLRNNGYTVIDLGKSVDAETIVEKAIEHKADFIGLSALMTTTMTEMPKVVDLVRRRKLPFKVVLGGAVVTQKYADEIGADGYGADAGRSIKLMDALLQKHK
ncbi:homocysteine S-methyltransferase family protein [bacterium]|nr:homocysteine S-methyltransferase family protein [bacterium]